MREGFLPISIVRDNWCVSVDITVSKLTEYRGKTDIRTINAPADIGWGIHALSQKQQKMVLISNYTYTTFSDMDALCIYSLKLSIWISSKLQRFLGAGSRRIHFPFVKSGKATGIEPKAMDCSERQVTAIHAAIS